MQKVTRFSISINKELTNKFDRLIKQKNYANRSEAFRDLIRDYLVEEEWEEDKEIAATISLVYDHHVHDLQHVLTHMQHDFHRYILSTMHVHLDHDNCLEVLVLKGRANEIKKIADRLIGTKGVKHGKLIGTTTGKAIK